jgi:hypothetical protein
MWTQLGWMEDSPALRVLATDVSLSWSARSSGPSRRAALMFDWSYAFADSLVLNIEPWSRYTTANLALEVRLCSFLSRSRGSP